MGGGGYPTQISTQDRTHANKQRNEHTNADTKAHKKAHTSARRNQPTNQPHARNHTANQPAPVTHSHAQRPSSYTPCGGRGRVLTVRGQDPGSWQRGPMA